MEAIKKVKKFPYCKETRECASPPRFLSRLLNLFNFSVYAEVLWEVRSHKAGALQCPTLQTQV